MYNSFLEIECPILEVTLPGFSYAIQFGEETISPGFARAFTACDLKIQKENCGSKFGVLPDGVYVLKYSVSPNDEVYVKYNHLRAVELNSRYEKLLCDLDIADCEPGRETRQKMNVLQDVRLYLDAAVSKVEICHEPRKGIQLYTYAKKLLDDLECVTCN